MKRGGWLLLAALATGCPGGPDLLPDGGSIHGPITFRVSFRSSKATTMHLQTKDGPRWVTVSQGGKAVEVLPDCTKCACGACESCAPCAEPAPRVVQVPHLGSTTFVWNGLVHAPGGRCADKGADCFTRKSAAPGGYSARFCHGTAATTDASGGQTVTSPVCTEVLFNYPADAGVEHEVCDC